MAPSRREFLKSTVAVPALLSLSGAAPAFLARAARAAAAEDRRDTVLVVVQLSGGNDGLNTVVPYADDAYGRNRRTLRLTGKNVLRINDSAGFHPKMKGFARLLKEGRLSVLQGVGYAKSNRSHEQAMRDWHTARPAEPQCPTGWLGRAIDNACRRREAQVPGIFVGPIGRPFALTAKKAVVPSIRSAREMTLRAGGGPPGRAMPAHGADGNPLADYVRHVNRGAHATSRQIRAVLDGAPGTDRYPRQGLAGHLKTVAELIRARVGIRIFFTELGGGGIGGFDSHANQRDNHAALLGQLSDSVAAFADDLARHKCLDRVVLMTFSEFGRTLTENGRRGTGHGAAAPVFLMGGRLRAGLIGKRPNLADLDQDAPRFHTDFRRLYATVLEHWLGFDSEAVLGAKFKPLDLFVS
ncbi:MAG TPA: DUF1501 domain-containing protein [Phycisphaerae bacterium]|nr:DUF1501 domain-containing protein [Phycisphaerae bacterium]